MSQNFILEELKSRFSPDQLKRIKKELNLLFTPFQEENSPDFPQISLELKPNKNTGLFLKVLFVYIESFSYFF